MAVDPCASFVPVGPPLTIETLGFEFEFPFQPASDIKQLQVDTINVLEHRVCLQSFPKDYQEKIKNYWRFEGFRQSSKSDFGGSSHFNEVLDFIK